MEKLQRCIEFMLLTLVLWLLATIMIFAGGSMLILGPIIALWALIDKSYDDDDEYE